MTIQIINHPINDAAKIFQLDDIPSVLNAADTEGISFHSSHEANAKSSPAIAAIFIKFLGKIEKIRIKAIGGSNGIRKTDAIEVTLKNKKHWEKDITPKAVQQFLSERLANGATIIVVADIRKHFDISVNDIEQSIRALRPQSVDIHNKEEGHNPDEAIIVTKGGWDPKKGTLKLALGKSCGADSTCGEINKSQTKRVLGAHLAIKYPDVRIEFVDAKPS